MFVNMVISCPKKLVYVTRLYCYKCHMVTENDTCIDTVTDTVRLNIPLSSQDQPPLNIYMLVTHLKLTQNHLLYNLLTG